MIKEKTRQAGRTRGADGQTMRNTTRRIRRRWCRRWKRWLKGAKQWEGCKGGRGRRQCGSGREGNESDMGWAHKGNEENKGLQHRHHRGRKTQRRLKKGFLLACMGFWGYGGWNGSARVRGQERRHLEEAHKEEQKKKRTKKEGTYRDQVPTIADLEKRGWRAAVVGSKRSRGREGRGHATVVRAAGGVHGPGAAGSQAEGGLCRSGLRRRPKKGKRRKKVWGTAGWL